MFKLIITGKRKPGMSMDEFRQHYEKRHAVLAQGITPRMRRYIRNYVTPVLGGSSPGVESPFDCITEVWFDSEEDFIQTSKSLLSEPHKTAAVNEDIDNLFDRATIWRFTSVQCESEVA